MSARPVLEGLGRPAAGGALGSVSPDLSPDAAGSPAPRRGPTETASRALEARPLEVAGAGAAAQPPSRPSGGAPDQAPDRTAGRMLGEASARASGQVANRASGEALEQPKSAAELPTARSARAVGVMVGLAAALVVLAVVSAGSGQMHLGIGEVVRVLAAKLGWSVGAEPTAANAEAVVLSIRLPRLALAALAGAALATAGAVMQGVFRNPLAEPGVIGVSSGAAAAACGGIALGAQAAGPWAVAALAFAGGLGTTLAVYGLSRSGGRTEVVTLVLTGVAVNAVAGAAIALFVFLADTSAREEIIFWQLGSLNGTRWQYVAVAAPIILVATAWTMTLARPLDLLTLGERSARHLGVDVERLRIGAIVLVALLTAAAVAFCGIIAFVGLVVPHLVRMALGPGHRTLLPASALGGAVLLLAADLAARTAVDYADLPIGLLTSLVGGPFFFYLLRRTRRRAGGWG